VSDFDGSPLGDDVPPHAPVRYLAALGGDGPASSTTTYCYRTALGVRGATTDSDAIPAGAEVERVVTT
jgi:hypothetical protein